MENNIEPVDPDPFSIASTFIAAAALILQFFQMRQAVPSNANELNRQNRNQILDQLENQTDISIDKGNRLLRSLDRGLEDSDRDFYDKPYQVGEVMMLSADQFQQYQQALAEMYTALSSMSLWINHAISNDPLMAARIGNRLNDGLSGMTARLNRILSAGLPNRQAVEEGKAALRALHDAIAAEQGRKN